MRGGSTDIIDCSPAYAIAEERQPDGRFKLSVSGTDIAVIGADSRLAWEECRRQLNAFLYQRQAAPAPEYS